MNPTSVVPRASVLSHEPGCLEYQLSTFPTRLGWFGIVGSDESVVDLTLGHASPGAVHERLCASGAISRETSPVDWWPELRERLQSYADGAEDDFADIKVISKRTTAFQEKVVTAVRRVGYGETLSYGELAERAGSPRAARAVGHVMATNRIPIIVPCHRVIASNGRLGGYSAPRGLDMKEELLRLEGVTEFSRELVQ